MKPRKRVVTGPPGGARAPAGGRNSSGKRAPTVRRIRSAIVPAAKPGRLGAADPSGRGRGRPAAVEPGGGGAGSALPAAAAVDLSVGLASRTGLRLRNPILVAAGCAGYGPEVAEALGLAGLGALVTRTTTLRPRGGGPAPRLVERPGVVLWATGLPNPGIEAVLERYGPAWPSLPTTLVVSVGGETAGEIAEVVGRLEDSPGVAALELNLAELRAGSAEPATLAGLVGAARRSTDRPLIVKLPYVEDPRGLGRAAVEAGADALAGPGGLRGRVFTRGFGRPLARRSALGTERGFLAGPVVFPLGLDFVAALAAAVRVPIVGLGGVRSVADVLDYLAAGATAVGVGTAALADPGLPGRLVDGLRTTCALAGVGDLGALLARLRAATDEAVRRSRTLSS